jgi:ubiquinone/menaquinone biosynthesis C-methylase UbiE
MNHSSPINYDVIAPKYDARYAQNPLAGVSRELRALVAQSQARDVLEVGCGTGHWVGELRHRPVADSPGWLESLKSR